MISNLFFIWCRNKLANLNKILVYLNQLDIVVLQKLPSISCITFNIRVEQTLPHVGIGLAQYNLSGNNRLVQYTFRAAQTAIQCNGNMDT